MRSFFFFLDSNQDYLMQIISDADQHRMLFYKQPVAHCPSVWLYLIHSDEETQTPCSCLSKISAAICAPKPLRASIKTEYKHRKTKTPSFSSLPQLPLTSGGRCSAAHVQAGTVQARAPSWHGVAPTESRGDLEPWLETLVRHTLFRPELFMLLR